MEQLRLDGAQVNKGDDVPLSQKIVPDLVRLMAEAIETVCDFRKGRSHESDESQDQRTAPGT